MKTAMVYKVAESPYARAREGVTGNQHLARLSRCKRAHIRLLSAPRSERATTRARFRTTWAIVDRLDRALHRLRAGPLQGVLAGLRGLPGARQKKRMSDKLTPTVSRRRWRLAGAVAVQQVLPGQSLARARRGVRRSLVRGLASFRELSRASVLNRELRRFLHGVNLI